MVGDDAPDKVWVGVAEGDHELGQLLLVELGDCAEHALPGDPAELCVCHGLLGHAHDLRCKVDGQAQDRKRVSRDILNVS